jgi:subtilisin family serine protease
MSPTSSVFLPHKVRFDTAVLPSTKKLDPSSELSDPMHQMTASGAIRILDTTDAGNSLTAATNLGTVGATALTRTDALSATDTVDFYRFSITGTNNFVASAGSLSADASLFLLDSNGQEIARAAAPGNVTETIKRVLSTGTYYLQVVRVSGATSYTLRTSAIAPDKAGNSSRAAQNLGTISGTREFYDAITSGDRDDFYKFTLAQNSNLNVSLTGLRADAEISLLDSQGRLIVSSTNSGTTSEVITRAVSAGTYFIRVYQYSGDTNYNLSIFSSTQQLAANYSTTFGYGLVNAAAAVARAVGTPSFAPVTDLGSSNWNLDRINAPEVWARGYTGQGITVAVIDTGVDYNHSDLAGNIWVNTREIAGNGIDDDGNGYVDDIHGWNFVDNNNTPLDFNGHGTHVAGTIAARNNGVGVTGVAHNAKIMAIQAISASGTGDALQVASGIRYAADNGARVINLSIGGIGTTAIRDAVEYATKKGAVVVMAAGNSSGAEPTSPANLANLWGIAVGAIDSQNKFASFSDRAGATGVNYVVAPGVNILSLGLNNTYRGSSGTSMATPHIAGVAALMLGANSTLLPEQVVQMIAQTATSTGVTV